MADRAAEPAQNALLEIRKINSNAELFIGDLASSQDALALMAFAEERFGGIDISVHNVGGTIWTQPFWKYTEAQIEMEMQRSLWPTMWCCWAVLPIMIKQMSGVIINIGSVATRGINRVPYSTAKGGVAALTTCVALETAEYGIRVNCVAPGGTNVLDRTVPRVGPAPDEINVQGMDAVIEQTLRDTPLGRFGTVDEQASTVAFLASDEASYITGQTLYVAGGGIG